MVKKIKDKSGVECNFYLSAEDVADPRKLSYLKNKNTFESYYVRGRHSNVDCFYLA